jgi:hypothetical protein
LTQTVLGQEFGIEEDAIPIEVGNAFAKRDQRPLAVGTLDLEQVTRTEILDRYDRADGPSVAVHASEADEVGVVIFAVSERRQSGPFDFDERAAKTFGSRSVPDPLEAREGGPLS